MNLQAHYWLPAARYAIIGGTYDEIGIKGAHVFAVTFVHATCLSPLRYSYFNYYLCPLLSSSSPVTKAMPASFGSSHLCWMCSSSLVPD